MDDMTVETVHKEIMSLILLVPKAAGEGLVRCYSCRHPLWASTLSREQSLLKYYECWRCGMLAPIDQIDAYLQEIVTRHYNSPSFIHRWRKFRATDLDKRVENGRRCLEWCTDHVNRKRLSHFLSPLPLGLGGRRGLMIGQPFWVSARRTVRRSLLKLVYRICEDITQRASINGSTKNDPMYLDDMAALFSTYLRTGYSDIYWLRQKPLYKQSNYPDTFDGKMSDTEGRIRNFIANQEWIHAELEPDPEFDPAMEDGWSTSPGAWIQRRHDLTRVALSGKYVYTHFDMYGRRVLQIGPVPPR